MSSDGERQPQPSKRRRLVTSDSDSSEGSIVASTHRKRRVYRVVSDPESSDDDGDVPKPVTRRKNYRVVSDDNASYSSGSETADSQMIEGSTSSEWQTDWESASDDSEDESIEHNKRSRASKSSKTPKKVKIEDSPEAGASNAGCESDASDGQSEKCPICLLPFREQEVATPSTCEHCFCLLCLMEWTKNINTCPVDRQAFTSLHVRTKYGKKVARVVPIETKTNNEEQIQEDPTYCEVCHQCDREDRMLLCDGCDLGYHLECLDPPMNEVPMDEWYCPECTRNSQDDAEMVDIDLDEISDLMAEARGLGLSYGRTRTGIPSENAGAHRIVPRTRQAERVRANIRAGRNRTRTREIRDNTRAFDPDQPSTSSSGMDSISENRSSVVTYNAAAFGVAAIATTSSSSRTRRIKTTRRAKTTRRSKKKRTVANRAVASGGERMVREVRIREYDDDGQEREIVTYVNVAPTSTKRRKRRTKRSRKKRSRRARTVSSLAAAMKTVKKRLANTLGIVKPIAGVTLTGPNVKVRRTPTERGLLNDSRFRAGIAQVSIFGNNLGLNYSPPGSDDDIDSAIGGDGPLIGTHRRTAGVSSTRRRFALKGMVDPVVRSNDLDTGVGVDLISSIIDSQELWHSGKRSDVTLKADGTLLIEKKNRENAHSVNNNNSPVKKKDETKIIENAAPMDPASIPSTGETPLDLSSVNPSDITQAPMYNNPRGGNRGNFRGGYRDGTRHSHGGQGNYGGRESYTGGSGTGRHSFGGTGSHDNFGNREFGPPANYNQNFEHRGPPPPFGGTPPFRNRHPLHFRPDRLRMQMPERPMFPPPMDNHERPPFPHLNHFAGPGIPLGPPPGPPPGLPPGMLPNMPGAINIRPPPPPPPLSQAQQDNAMSNFHEDLTSNLQVETRETYGPELQNPSSTAAANSTTPERPDDEECDIYCDIEAPNKADNDTHEESGNDGSTALLPPPEPPSGLLDFEEDNSKSEKDNDSDQELVIDDTPKDERSIRGGQHDDKYDPFAADSDTNDSDRESKNVNKCDKEKMGRDNETAPLDPPPMPPQFPKDTSHASINPLLRLTAYDDDDDEDSQDDCPNFSIYSSATMDVARHTEQELSQQIGPLEPPPLPPDMPDDDDVIVGDVQTCDLADIPEPSDPYVEALRKERQTLSRIPPKKISNDARGKITFKIGNKFKLNNKLSNLYDELDENIEVSIEQEKEIEEKRNKLTAVDKAKKATDFEKNDEIFSTDDIRKKQHKEKNKIEDKEDPSEEKSAQIEQAKKNETKTSEVDKKNDIIVDRKDSIDKDEDNDEEETKEKCKMDESSKPLKEEDDENKSEERGKVKEACLAMSTIDLTEKSSDTIISITESVQSSPKKADSRVDVNPERSSTEPTEKNDSRTREWRSLARERASDDEKLSNDGSDNEDEDEDDGNDEDDDNDNRKIVKARKLRKRSIRIERSSDGQSDTEDRSSENEGETKNNAKTSYSSSLDQARAGASSSFDVDDETENFPLEKETIGNVEKKKVDNGWESDGAYTPCKDERPVKEKENRGSASPFESGLEPITPTKDRANDDLDGCRTPVGYAGLGTEAISETDEAMNFEDELTLLSLRKEKEMEDGEIMDDGKLPKKHSGKSLDLDDSKRKRKKEKKDRGKDTEKNKENISLENQVSWKKISKSTKDRQYRDKDKRSRSRERDKGKPKKKLKETTKKKEKRKEMARYDVRKIVAEKPVRPRKDEYGRDLRDYSRSNTRSRSLTRHRTISRDRRTRSRSRSRSRSYSRIRSRSRSRSRARRSWSRDRRSISKGRRSLSRRRSSSRGRRKRSMTPRRSVSKKRSVSRRRGSKSPMRKRRSLSTRRRRRSLSRKHRSRSRDKRKEKTKKHMKSRSRSRNRKRTRSKSPKRVSSKSREKRHLKRKLMSRSRSKHRSLSRERERNRNWNPMNDKQPMERERHFSREKETNRESWSAQWTPSWSRSRSPIINQHEELAAHGWSPPPALDGVTVPPKNLTVILTNKEAIRKKKKEKRKENKKGRIETDRRRRNKRTRTPPPSKEVFASGDNILVSVCFNKENETIATGLPELPETIPLLATTKRRRREPITTEPAKKQKKDKAKEKRAKSPKGKKERKKKSKAAEIAATKKPVAVIDLDQSPFREQTPSPRDIIVLSDDDEKQAQELATPEQHPRPSTPQHDQFVSQGPKTPPEPQIKFLMNKQTNLRPSMMNPLLEEEEEEEEEIDERVEEELEMRAQEELELRLKIGPNTPPEPPSSPPTSPDAYDPFDPTKSRSPTPTASQDATPNDERDRNQRNSPRKHDVDDENLTIGETPLTQDTPSVEKQQTEKPKIISMVTIKRASPKRDGSPVIDNQTETVQAMEMSPTKVQQNQQNTQSTVNPFATINPVLATVAAAVQRSAGLFNTSTPITGQRNLQQPNRISPSTQMKQRIIDRPQLPNLFANVMKTTPVRMQKTLQNKNISTIGQNGSDANLDMSIDNVIDMSSPYSPGSSLSDGIFDPPSPGNHNSSPVNVTSSSNKVGASKNNKTTEKKDAFDALFGTSPAMKAINKGRGKKMIEREKRAKKSTNPKVGVRMDENQLQILDDLPSSAVEMQVKDKFLKKLNRQERVVEEVKLVLKPHYTKKHVTKEEYKDIMRKAVPKICHNKTGEINPKKIAQLIEAYVKKCRSFKKKKPGLPTNSTGKTVKPVKNLWS